MDRMYHETHEDAMQWDCMTCCLGAVLAQVEDLARVDAAEVLRDALQQVEA